MEIVIYKNKNEIITLFSKGYTFLESYISLFLKDL